MQICVKSWHLNGVTMTSGPGLVRFETCAIQEDMMGWFVMVKGLKGSASKSCAVTAALHCCVLLEGILSPPTLKEKGVQNWIVA